MTTTTSYHATNSARRSVAQALQATHPYLTPVKGDTLIAATKNIRTELKRAFPSVKFSVRSRRFSGGDAIDVSWTDGPTVDMVDVIIDKYSAGSFDGMTDCYNYERSAWTDAFGDAKYVHSTRHYSDAFIARAIQYLQAKYTNPQLRVNVEDFRAGRLWNVPWYDNGREDVQHMISLTLAKRAACVPAVSA